MAITFNQQSVVQTNPNTSTPPDTTPRITEEILNQIRDDQYDEIFYVSTDPTSNKLYSFLKEIYDISPDLLIDDSEANYTIATSVGITITLGGIVYDKSARDLKKLTYLLAFRTAFRKVYVTQNNQTVLTAHPENFESWWEKANGLRFLDWSKKYSDPSLITIYGEIIKRLCKNGEEEVWTGTGIPNSEIDPPLEYHLNNTQSKYDSFGVDVDSLLIKQGFWNSSIPPIEYYWLGQTETPYFESWIEKEKSKPFIPTNNLSNPYISENFDSVILNIQDFNLSEYYTNSTGLGNEKQLPRVISIIDNNTNEVEVRIFKRTAIELFCEFSPNLGPSNFDGYTIKRNSSNGDFFLSRRSEIFILYTNLNHNEKLSINYLNGEEVSSKYMFNSETGNGYCIKLVSEIKQATVQIPENTSISLQDILNVPAKKIIIN